MAKLLVIPDTQVKPNVRTEHFTTALANYVAAKRPDTILHVGDHFDLPSLSSYDLGKAEFSDRDILDDIDAGNEAMAGFNRILAKERNYKPARHFTLGNHEHRVTRFIEAAENQRFKKLLSLKSLNLEGWRVHPFLKPVKLYGIHCAHYWPSPMTGRPLGGNAHYKLTKLKFSYIMGHVQIKDTAQEFLANGQVLRGLMAGTFYQHDEDYLGPQQHYWRGVHLLHECRKGNYDLLEVSLNYLLREYL